jgi:hypothetical protein
MNKLEKSRMFAEYELWLHTFSKDKLIRVLTHLKEFESIQAEDIKLNNDIAYITEHVLKSKIARTLN